VKFHAVLSLLVQCVYLCYPTISPVLMLQYYFWMYCVIVFWYQSVCFVQTVREEDIREFFSQMEARKRQKSSEGFQYHCK
jgi:hypothetical protein